MATVSVTPSNTIPAPPFPGRPLTAADLAVMPERLPSGSVSCELHHGVLVPMSPPVARHGSIQAIIGAELIHQGQKKGLGNGYTEVGVLLAKDPDHVLGPDAAFVMKQSLPARLTPEGYLETVPQLIVEIRNKNETAKEVSEKVADYLKAGAVLVWVVEPTQESVVEHRAAQPPKTYLKSDSLACEDVIPGFRLALVELFR
jgi:Uma2 family endonuclease